MSYAFSHASEIDVPAQPATVFETLDDPLRLGRHMTKPSAMMLGGSMQYRLDASGGRAVGSIIRVEGSILGVRLQITERVVERDPPRRKVWETVEEPKLIVFGKYRLGFDITQEGRGCRLRVFIDYDLPGTMLGRLLGPLAARGYASWCVNRMLNEASAAHQA
jgi:hypothetical protein